jgi:hypothetical protein
MPIIVVSLDILSALMVILTNQTSERMHRTYALSDVLMTTQTRRGTGVLNDEPIWQ